MSKQKDIKVIATNKPTKEESARITKELCVFLAQVWTAPPKDK